MYAVEYIVLLLYDGGGGMERLNVAYAVVFSKC
jgi:hypothetical protein